MAVEKVCEEGMCMLCSTMGGVESGPSRVFGIRKELDGVRKVDRRRVKGLARLQAEPRVGVGRWEKGCIRPSLYNCHCRFLSPEFLKL